LVATASSIDWFIDAKMLTSINSEMSLNGFKPRATAKSRTMIGGFAWIVLTLPFWDTETEDGAGAIGGVDFDTGSGAGTGRAAATGTGGGSTGAFDIGGALGADRTIGGWDALKAGRATGTGGGRTGALAIGGALGADRMMGGGDGGRIVVTGAGDATASGRAGGAAALTASSRSRATSCTVFTNAPVGKLTLGSSATATGADAATSTAGAGGRLAATSSSSASAVMLSTVLETLLAG
jgi:hypothetical protein